jgi:hypothetical protein
MVVFEAREQVAFQISSASKSIGFVFPVYLSDMLRITAASNWTKPIFPDRLPYLLFQLWIFILYLTEPRRRGLRLSLLHHWFFLQYHQNSPRRAWPYCAQGRARSRGTGRAAYAVAESKLKHDRVGASRLTRLWP